MGYLYQCATKDGRESELMTAKSAIDAARKYTGVFGLKKAEKKGNKLFWDIIVYKFDSRDTNKAISEHIYVRG